MLIFISPCRRSGVQRFRVQGFTLVLGLDLGCVFANKAVASSGLIQNLELNWQLFEKRRIFNEDFGPFMPYLSLFLNLEPRTPYLVFLNYERVP
jgi:hypothetical protein